MLLQRILALFDEELDRLGRLRGIVSDLAGPSIVASRLQSPTELAELSAVASEASPALQRAERTQVRTARKPRRAKISEAKQAHEPTALGGAIPSAPVVVSAEALARAGVGSRRAAAKSSTPTPAPGTLGSMIRALRLEASS